MSAAKCRMLAACVAYNSTLMTLHLARKNIQDNEGQDLARMLVKNTTLRKLELEGNNLGPMCAYEFARALKANKTLKYLDLESNQLTADGTINGGVVDLFKFLPENSTLISLNLANNAMFETCGEQFNQLLSQNDTLIDFDFSMNQFSLEDSREIQDKLRRNKAKYDNERLREWRERKQMKLEDEKLKELYMQQNSKKEQGKIEEEAREINEKEMDEKWKEFMLNAEIEKQQTIQMLLDAAQDRGKKKGKKKGGKKKKKG